jgi:ABC-type sugar transport system substrate-binding protein
MDNREHLARQAAGAVDDVIEQHERGEAVDPVDVVVLQANLRAAQAAGIHPFELDQYRRTAPLRD